MNRCCYDVDLPTEGSLRKDFKFPIEPLVQGLWTYQAPEIFNTEWIKMCEDRGVYLKGDVMLFYKAPYLNAHRAHIDINTNSHTTWALNWTINNNTSSMMWFKKPEDNIDKIYPKSNDDKYIEWDSRKLELIDSKEIKSKMVLCRVDVPHDIKVGKQPRWCISARGWLGDENDLMPDWNTVVNKFKELSLI